MRYLSQVYIVAAPPFVIEPELYTGPLAKVLWRSGLLRSVPMRGRPTALDFGGTLTCTGVRCQCRATRLTLLIGREHGLIVTP